MAAIAQHRDAESCSLRVVEPPEARHARSCAPAASASTWAHVILIHDSDSGSEVAFIISFMLVARHWPRQCRSGMDLASATSKLSRIRAEVRYRDCQCGPGALERRSDSDSESAGGLLASAV